MGSRAVRVGLVGIGNCAASFLQGLAHYRDAATPGLMTDDIGGYRVSDIEVVAAFDVVAGKVGQDVADAVFAAPNNTLRFADPPATGVAVARGPTLDGIGSTLRDTLRESDEPVADVAALLRRAGVDVLVNYLPVGAQRATEFYAEQALPAAASSIASRSSSRPTPPGATASRHAACR